MILDEMQNIVVKGYDMFFCNDKILETIKEKIPIVDSTPLSSIYGYRLIKVSRKEMKRLLKLSECYNK